MNLVCYQIHDEAPELISARPERAWMDATYAQFANRCTPLSIANATGWELVCPSTIDVTWNGNPGRADIVIEYEGGAGPLPQFVQSMFGHGILTFHPGYLFRTDPEWALWCRGAPNCVKDGIVPLDGLVETDWLPFTFTMNWQFTRPGTVRFEKGEPFCFILPLPHIDIETIRPKILPLAENPGLQTEYAAWSSARTEFNERQREGDPRVNRERWQQFYRKGKAPEDVEAFDTHRDKRAMAKPVRLASVRGLQPTGAPASSVRQDNSTRQNIIWIASYPKSGNTWTRTFLHNLLKELSGHADGIQDINRLTEHTDWELPRFRFEQILGKSVDEATKAEIAWARPEVQRQLANSRAAPFFVKTHLCFGNDHRTPTINLDATLAAIYIVRNPLDVVISYAHHSGQSVKATITHMASRGLRTPGTELSVYEILGSWSQHVASWTGITHRPVHLIRYEDMLANPERVFGGLARFLRLQPSEEQLKRAVAKSSFAELRRQEDEHGFQERPDSAERFFREGRSGQWSEALTRAQVEAICRVHAPVMQRFGYLLPDCGRSLVVAPSKSTVQVQAI
jgi:hypothetical protein